jgi:energy-coupling factor transporter transmembrane protein EcfT
MMVAISFAPLLLVFASAKVRSLLHVAALIVWLMMIGISIFVGAVFYNFTRNVDGHKNPVDWLALIAAFIFGIGILVALRSVSSHRMDRAIDYMTSSPDDD